MGVTPSRSRPANRSTGRIHMNNFRCRAAFSISNSSRHIQMGRTRQACHAATAEATTASAVGVGFLTWLRLFRPATSICQSTDGRPPGQSPSVFSVTRGHPCGQAFQHQSVIIFDERPRCEKIRSWRNFLLRQSRRWPMSNLTGLKDQPFAQVASRSKEHPMTIFRKLNPRMLAEKTSNRLSNT